MGTVRKTEHCLYGAIPETECSYELRMVVTHSDVALEMDEISYEARKEVVEQGRLMLGQLFKIYIRGE